MNKILKNSKKFFLLLIFFFFFFPNFVRAGITEDIWNWLSGAYSWITAPLAYIVTLLFRIPLFFFALIGVAIATIAILIGWLLVPPIVNALIALSLNSAFYQGFQGTWELVREFSLSLVRIFLLIIGLLTIFRVREYEARKTLVSLIIAALLLSFSFEIGKKIIQWGNVFTNYVANNFFKVGAGGNYLPNIGDIYAELFNDLMNHSAGISDIFTRNGDLSKFFTTNLWIIILISFSYWVFAFLSLYISFVLLALGIVFLVRLAYLVCLLIVSPIAFLTAGLRAREIKQIFGGFLNWDGWWPAFLEWVFVGVILMIWLGVAVNIFDIVKNQVKSLNIPDCATALSTQDPTIVSKCNEEVKFLADGILKFLPSLAAAVAIHIGVKTSPGIIKQAVERIIGAATLVVTAATTAGVAAVTAGAGAFSAATAAGASKWGALGAGLKKGVTEGAKTFGGRMAVGFPGAMEKALPEEFRPGYEALVKVPAEEVTRRVPWVKRKITAPLIYEREEAEKAVEEIYKKEGAKGVLKTAEDPFATREMRIESILKAMREGFDKGKEWMKNKEMRELTLGTYEEAAKKGDKKTMEMIERRLVGNLEQDKELRESFEKIATENKMYDKDKEGTFIERIIKGVKTADDMKQLQGRWWENPEAMSAAKEFWTGAQWGAAARQFGKELMNALEPIIEDIKSLQVPTLAPEKLAELQKKYRTDATDKVGLYKAIIYSMPGLARYSETAAAQEVGIPSLYTIAPDEVKFATERKVIRGKEREVRKYRNIREILAEKPPEKREVPIKEEEIERKRKELEKRMKELEK